jgi:hypothetical protein
LADAGRLLAKLPWRYQYHQAWISATELLMTAAERGGSIESATDQIEGALFLSHMLVLTPTATKPRSEGAAAAPARGSAAMKMPSGAHFEISVDGKPRSHRDTKAMAIEGAEYLKQRHPPSEVTVKDLTSGDVTLAARKIRAAAGLT